MNVIIPKSVKVIKSVNARCKFVSSESAKTKVEKKPSAKAKVEKKPSDKVIGFFYNMYKKPLNFLFILLKKERKSKDDKEKIKDIVSGLRKAEKKHQKENNYSDSVVDLLIEQRKLKLGKLEASNISSKAIASFYLSNKKSIDKLCSKLKSESFNIKASGINQILDPLKTREKEFYKRNSINADSSILSIIVGKKLIK